MCSVHVFGLEYFHRSMLAVACNLDVKAKAWLFLLSKILDRFAASAFHLEGPGGLKAGIRALQSVT